MSEKKLSVPLWTFFVMAALMLLALLYIGFNLHRIQVDEQRSYSQAMLRQSVRRVLIPATRGKIYDRNGVCLADNRPSYCIAVFVEDLRRAGNISNTINNVDVAIDNMASRLNIPRQITRSDIEKHIRRRLPLPLLAWQDIDGETLAKFSEILTPELGMDIYVQPERVYPLGTTAAHILGYVGRDKPLTDDSEVFHYNIMGMKGRSGIEASLNNILSGVPGGKLITVDVSGYHRGETTRPAVSGSDVTLSIDSRLQARLEELIAGFRSAGVCVNPKTGEILALASAPTFNPNDLSPSIPRTLWNKLNAGDDHPLLNRAISGNYPPGSVFKPCVALAALESGVSPDIKFNCDGVFKLGSLRLRCSARYGHGDDITIRYALEQSCNPFFCSLGVHISPEIIRDQAIAFGLGRRTGIELPGEANGLVPDDAWKRRVKREGWRPGDTANFAIGQGFLLASPLQIAMYAAALANGKSLMRPYFVLSEGSKPEVVRNLGIKKANLDIVRGGMYDVANAERGTGRTARLEDIAVAAKTGTAEYGPASARRKHTWMIAFAPYEDPQIAMAVVVEDGDSGGKTVGPIIQQTLRYYFDECTTTHATKEEENDETI